MSENKFTLFKTTHLCFENLNMEIIFPPEYKILIYLFNQNITKWGDWEPVLIYKANLGKKPERYSMHVAATCRGNSAKRPEEFCAVARLQGRHQRLNLKGSNPSEVLSLYWWDKVGFKLTPLVQSHYSKETFFCRTQLFSFDIKPDELFNNHTTLQGPLQLPHHPALISSKPSCRQSDYKPITNQLVKKTLHHRHRISPVHNQISIWPTAGDKLLRSTQTNKHTDMEAWKLPLTLQYVHHSDVPVYYSNVKNVLYITLFFF